MRVAKTTDNNTAATTIQITINPHPPQRRTTAHKTPGVGVEHQSCGGHSTGETPSNISNLEAKPGSANGTATDRLWESRTPPQHTSGKRPGTQRFLAAPLSHTQNPRSRSTYTQNPTQRTHPSQRQIPIEYEPHQAAWTNNCINKASTTCHNPSTPSLNPPAYHSTRPHPQRVRAGNHRSLCAWGMLAAVWLWCDTPTDLCRPHFASWHGMLEAWSLLHIREGRTATGGATRYSPSAWRRTTASPINPR